MRRCRVRLAPPVCRNRNRWWRKAADIGAFPIISSSTSGAEKIIKADLINEQKKKGVAVIFVGEDLDVLMELSDRIMVLCGGEVSGILDARKTDKNEVGMLMTRVGGKEHEGKE